MRRGELLAPASVIVTVAAIVVVSIACNGVLGIPEVERLPSEAGVAPPSGGGCSADQKTCGGRCVEVSSPVTGCGAVSCDPCKVANGVATCRDGACVVETCAPGWGDCNVQPDDGCEYRVNEPNNCGFCGLKCPPGFVCGADACECNTPTACGTGGTCNAGLCTCAGVQCFPGWLCGDEGGCSPL